MEKICVKSNCKGQIAFVCNCSAVPVYSCAKHFGDHMLQKGEHTLIPLLLTLDENERKELFNEILRARDYCNRLAERNLEITDKILKTVINESKIFMKAIQDFEQQYNKMLSSLTLLTTIDKEDYENIKKFVFPQEYKLTMSANGLQKNIKKLYSDHLASKIKKNCQEISNNCKHCIGVVENEDEFEILTIDTLKISHKAIPSQLNIGHYSAACRLTGEKYFFYGGWTSNKDYLGEACTFDFETDEYEILPSSDEIFLCGGIKKDDNIFIFGGCKHFSSPTSECKKFDFLDEK